MPNGMAAYCIRGQMPTTDFRYYPPSQQSLLPPDSVDVLSFLRVHAGSLRMTKPYKLGEPRVGGGAVHLVVSRYLPASKER